MSLLRPVLIFTLAMFLMACGATPDSQDSQDQQNNKKNTRNANSKQEIKEIQAKSASAIARGAEYFNAKNYQKAINEFEAALQEDPKSAMAVFNIGLCYEKLGNQEKAVEYFQKNTELGKGDGLVHIGLMKAAAGQDGEAEALYQQALSVEPLNGRAHLNLARIAKGRKDYKEAIDRVKSALTEDSANGDAYDLLAQIYYDLGRYELALLVCDAGLQDIDPNHSGMYNTLGLVQLKLKQVIKALNAFKKAIEFDEDNVAALMNYGSITFGYRDYELSYQIFSKALAKDPNHTEALLSKAVAARSLGKVDEARADYQKLLAKDPNHMPSIFNMGIILQEYDRKFDEALGKYQQALSLAQDPSTREMISKRIEEATIAKEALDAEKEQQQADQANQAPAPAEGQPKAP
jgi:tetratricopeptide (TPR) repeat protein